MKSLAAVGIAALASVSVFAASVPPVPTLPPLPSGSVGGVVAPTLPLSSLPRVKGGAFDLRFVTVGQLVDLLYGDALHVPHVIDSDVLQDGRLVSFQYDGKGDDLRSFVRTFLDEQGFRVDTRDGVDFISKRPAVVEKDAEREPFVYFPKYRTAEYLAKAVESLFPGHVGALGGQRVDGPVASPAVPASGASSVSVSMPVPTQVARSSVTVADQLIYYGEASEIRDLKKVLAELDRQPGEVVVRGWVYEVSDTDAKNSAFSLAVNVLGGQLGLANGSTDSDSTALRFSGKFLSFAISALDADSRFRQVSDPHARVVSGERVRLSVGSQVPTLGSISYQGSSGIPVQSVDYQDAGLIFDVQPVVLGESIRVQLDEQISSFVSTTTGVNNSPTKNTREMSTVVNMKDGEVVVLGGLVQDQDSSSRNSIGWLPSFLDGKSSGKGRSEILLVLQVSKVADL